LCAASAEPERPMIKVLIADDHAIVRKGLREILRGETDLQVAGEASDGLAAIDHALAETWDMVVLDITMPGASGVEVLKRLKRDRPALPVIMLSMHANPLIVKGCVEIGANGYVVKEAAPEELVAAIRTALRGEVYLCHAVRETMEGGIPPVPGMDL
jgi:two-component system, NarL family, invasion response regulator UvrY